MLPSCIGYVWQLSCGLYWWSVREAHLPYDCTFSPCGRGTSLWGQLWEPTLRLWCHVRHWHPEDVSTMSGHWEELAVEPNTTAAWLQWLEAPSSPPVDATSGRLLQPSFPSMAGGGEEEAGHWSHAVLGSVLCLQAFWTWGQHPKMFGGPKRARCPRAAAPALWS